MDRRNYRGALSLARTWSGGESSVNVHVWASIFLGGGLAALPLILVLTRSGSTLTRHVVAACEMMISALLIDITGGRIETHFHIFGALALLSFYRDWRVLVTASVVPRLITASSACSRHRTSMVCT